MPNQIDEEKQLLEVLKLIDAHRNGEIDADELEEAIWRVRNGTHLLEAPWLWMVVAALLAAAILLYALA
jgi:hypothetical protein